MDAVGVWYYGGKLLYRTVAGLVKYTPADVPIYIINHSPPEMLEAHQFAGQVTNRFAGRVLLYNGFASRDRWFSPFSIIRFLEAHPNIERLLKIDDDHLVHCDVFSGARAAYEAHQGTLFSVVFNPINIWGIGPILNRLGKLMDFPSELCDQEGIYDYIRTHPAITKTIWATFQPTPELLAELRTHLPRFVLLPASERNWCLCHYFAHRDDILAVGGHKDEQNWHWRWQATRRPRIMDTWTLAYHFAWYPWSKYAMRNVWPLAQAMKV